ncbi:hypothetical protein V500_07659 [Pseudogymnoascus sp. VKM F-4518 (FW-2643)]|nr:hypothetical protein V500_07659 [Pseudogymnoascus sp. VKM F-4518 (FW-2643)]KFZ09402.1 hypothetical protein V502_08786 [Pseudogymnoascus sp. VKM F-4520 (FW-2644)]
MALGEKSQSATFYGVPMKHVSLITLTFQNSALILIMHYSRIMPVVGGHRYFTSTAVLLNEVLKLSVSLTIALYDISRTMPPSTPATALFEQLYNSVFSGDGWKLAIPATLYTLQNSLQYIAILTTALFSVTMLRRTLSGRKWTALVLLTVGVVIVQLPSSDKVSYATILEDASKFAFPRSFHEVGQAAQHAADEVTKRSLSALLKRSATYEGIDKDLGLDKPVMNYSLGCIAVLTASVISGLTGVYFEKVLKDSSASITVWTRNVQLSFYSLFPALLIGVVYKDGGAIAKDGFFVGYNSVVWTAIAFQALGGVLVAMCINYADNIAKNFATSISIILSFLFSVWFFDFKVTFNFVIGTAVVIFATYLYSLNDKGRVRPPPINIASYEKTTIDNGYTPAEDKKNLLTPLDIMDTNKAGLSTSRPSSPVGHPRTGAWKGKRED